MAAHENLISCFTRPIFPAVWRRWIEPEYGICYRTYLSLLGIDPDAVESRRPDNHPSLFDDL